jgi:hypothetical protein
MPDATAHVRAIGQRLARRPGPARAATVLLVLCPLVLSLAFAQPAHAQDVPPVTGQGGDVSGWVPGLAAVKQRLDDVWGNTQEVAGSTQTVATFVSLLSHLDWQQVIWEMFTLIMTRLCQALVDAVWQLVDGLLNSSLNFVTRTPPEVTFDSPTVQGLWETTRRLANAGIAAVALWGGVNVVVRRPLGAPYHSALELLPRLAVGALLANTSRTWTTLFIELNNALCGAIGHTALPGWGNVPVLDRAVLDLALAVVYALVSLLLVAQMLLRLALLDLLIVVSPLAMLLWVLPQTQGWSRQWSSTFSTAVFTQLLQVTALRLGGSLLTEFRVAGGWGQANVVTYLVGIALLWLTFKVPALLRSHLGDGLGLVRTLTFMALRGQF